MMDDGTDDAQSPEDLRVTDDPSSQAGTVLLAFVLGAVAGGAIALLLAPQSGEAARRKLAERAREGRERATEAARQGREFLKNQRETISSAVERGREAFERAREPFDRAKGPKEPA
jgi:gas vesicle protein